LNAAGVAGLPSFASALATEVAADYPNQSAHHYQVTWEPEYNWGSGGTPAQLVQYFQLAYSAIHQADPKALVTRPTLFPEDITPLSNLWSAGLGNYLDAQSMHPYVGWPPETNGLVSNIRTQMGYRFQRNGITVLALWDYQAASSALNLAVPIESIQICDWMANCTNTTSSSGSIGLTLGASPVCVVGHGL